MIQTGMQPAQVYTDVETVGDYGKTNTRQHVKDITCCLSFSNGNVQTVNQIIAKSTTHIALTQDKELKAGMWLLISGSWYLIVAVAPPARFTILYLEHKEGIADA